jgi:hypothetical protein
MANAVYGVWAKYRMQITGMLTYDYVLPVVVVVRSKPI